MKFADYLKKERARLGLTQAQTAFVLDVPARTYWEWETAKTEPHAVTQEGCLARLRIAKKPRK